MRKWNMAIGEDQPDNKNNKIGKNKTLAKTGCVILDRVRIKNVWIHHMDRYIGNCLNRTKQKQYKKLSLQSSRALHLSASIASHALLMIMFKNVPLLFLVYPMLQNTDKQSQLFGQVMGKSQSDSLKKIFEILSQTTYEFVTK